MISEALGRRSRRRNWLICWTELIGEIPSTHGGPRPPDERLNKPRLINSGRAIYCTNQRDCAAIAAMAGTADHLPDDTDALKAALIEHLQLVIARMSARRSVHHREPPLTLSLMV